jgi:hypothetical protein
MNQTHPVFCDAQNRDGQPCRRHPAAGKRRCHYHGGAPGAGGQPANSNALKHGLYSGRVREFAADMRAAADHPFHLHDEIALLRAVAARAATSAQPQVVAMIAATLARLITVQHKLDSTKSHEDECPFHQELEAAVAEISALDAEQCPFNHEPGPAPVEVSGPGGDQ